VLSSVPKSCVVAGSSEPQSTTTISTSDLAQVSTLLTASGRYLPSLQHGVTAESRISLKLRLLHLQRGREKARIRRRILQALASP